MTVNKVVVADLTPADLIAGLLADKPDNWDREAAHRLLAEQGAWPNNEAFRGPRPAGHGSAECRRRS
jgi:hypothetical protein